MEKPVLYLPYNQELKELHKMFYIKSEKGYYNMDYNYWETNKEDATAYHSFDIASVVAEIIWVDNNIPTKVVC